MSPGTYPVPVSDIEFILFDQFRIGTSGAAVTSAQTNVLSPVPSSLRTADSKTLLSGTRTLQLVVSYQSGSGTTSGGVLSAGDNLL